MMIVSMIFAYTLGLLFWTFIFRRDGLHWSR